MKPLSPFPIFRAATLLLLVLPFPAAAQTASGDRGGLPQAGAPSPSTDIPALIQQLGSPYVRLRDEAEAKLKDLPDAQAPLRSLVLSAPASEAGLRAAHVLEILKHSEWTLTADLRLPGNAGSNGGSSSDEPGEFLMLRSLCPAPDARRCVGMFRGGAAILTLNPLALESVTGQPGSKNSQNWQGVRRALAISPDGKWIASGNDRGEILINDFSGNPVRKIPPSASPPTEESTLGSDEDTIRLTLDNPPSTQGSLKTRLPSISLTDSTSSSDGNVVWGLAFLPDNSRLLSIDGSGGLILHDFESGSRQSLPFPEMRPRCLSLSADGQYAAIGADPYRKTCRLFLVRLSDRATVLDTTVKTIPNGVSLNPDGSQILIAVNDGSIVSLDRDGGNRRPLHQFAAPATSVAFSTDGKRALATSLDPQFPVVVLNTETGAVEWAAASVEEGFHSAVWINQDHFASSSNDGHIHLWSRRGAPALPPASKPE